MYKYAKSLQANLKAVLSYVSRRKKETPAVEVS